MVAGAAAADWPPPWLLSAATGTLEVVEVVVMPRSLSTSLTGMPMLLAIVAALSPCWAICWIWAVWESCTVSWGAWAVVEDAGAGCCSCEGAGADPSARAGSVYERELMMGEMLTITSLGAALQRSCGLR